MSIFNFKHKVTIVIPVYKTALSAYEKMSLRQCCKMLSKHIITLVKPHLLTIDTYKEYGKDFVIESFEDDYFQDVKGYNRLMLSAEFYERFLQYDYILIHQLDAFVFKDELQYWCRKGYDYIGAPWLVSPFVGDKLQHKEHAIEMEKMYRLNVKQEGTNLPVDAQFANKVGNGGFSLRRVKKFYNICLQQQQLISFYNERNEHHFFNEDVFWSLEVNRNKKMLKIPGYEKAVFFSIEFKPEYAFELTKGKLPFACHDWEQFPDFWKSFFEKFGYTI